MRLGDLRESSYSVCNHLVERVEGAAAGDTAHRPEGSGANDVARSEVEYPENTQPDRQGLEHRDPL